MNAVSPIGSSRIVQYRKFDGALHWRHEMIYLGDDAHGVWFGAAKGATLQRGTEAPIEAPTPFVQLVHPTAMWTAIFNEAPAKFEIYVDMTTPAEWVDEHTVEYIDLDLDVIRRPTGETELLDEDEFAEHSQTMSYPAELIEATAEAAADLQAVIERGDEPFGSASREWLAKLSGLQQ